MPVDTRVYPRGAEHRLLVEAPEAWAEGMPQEAKLRLHTKVTVAPKCLSQRVVKNGKNEALPLELGARSMPMVKPSSAM